MRSHRMNVLASWIIVGAWFGAPAAAQEQQAPQPVPCRDRPCSVRVDWTRAGGIGNQVPDRRYGNPTHLEQRVKTRLTGLGFASLESSNDQELRILLIPIIGNAMCDEVAGTATDRSCRAIVDVEARVEGPDELRSPVDLPSRIRNRCPSDKVMAVDVLGAFVGDWIAYALAGKAEGERRPVARC